VANFAQSNHGKEGEMSSNGKHALITGNSRGIGRGIALRLAENGVNVAMNYVQNKSAAEDTLAQVRERGADGFIVQADVSRPDSIKEMLGKVESEFTTLDIFVSNARPEMPDFYSAPMDLTRDQLDRAMDSQAKAFLVGTRESVRLMPDGGRIIAIVYAPGGQFGSWQPWAAMGSAQGATVSLCRYFAVALAKRGITVNAISPGATDDSVLSGLPPEVFQMIKDWSSDWTPNGRLGTPADMGNAVSLFCSEDASWITGQTILVDGGASLMDPVFPLAIQQG